MSKDLDKEIEELEKLAFGTKDEGGEGGQSAETGGTGGSEPTTKSTAKETVDTVSTPSKAEEAKSRDWEKEYKTLRSSTDNYKFRTRTELAQLKERILSLNKEIGELKVREPEPKKDIFKDTFSDDDAKIVGPEALAMMQKAASTAAEASTKELQEELDKERNLRLKAEEQEVVNNKQKASSLFLQRLGDEVPDYADINLDPAFEKFIKEEDPINGGPRLIHFKSAERTGNVAVVAGYMREFRTTLGTKDTLEERVAPTGTATPTETSAEHSKLIPQSEILKFYSDIGKGLYKGKKDLQDKLEAKYDKAHVSGGIDHMR